MKARKEAARKDEAGDRISDQDLAALEEEFSKLTGVTVRSQQAEEPPAEAAADGVDA